MMMKNWTVIIVRVVVAMMVTVAVMMVVVGSHGGSGERWRGGDIEVAGVMVISGYGDVDGRQRLLVVLMGQLVRVVMVNLESGVGEVDMMVMLWW
jgi:hypothetical protein